MNYTGLRLITLDTWTDAGAFSIAEFTCTNDPMNKDRTITVAERKEPIMKDFCMPDTPETRALLQWRIEHKKEMKRLEDEHFATLMHRMNDLKRREVI